MKKRPIYWIVAGLALAATIALVLWVREPSYQGKSLTAWLDQLDDLTWGGYDARKYEEAIQALRFMADASVPRLARRLEKRHLPSFELARSKLRRSVEIGVWSLGKDYDDYYWPSIAAMTLGEIGPPASNAIPELIEASRRNQEHLSVDADVALMKIQRTLSATLTSALSDTKDYEKWLRAARAFWLLGPQAKATVPAFIAALKDDNAKIRQEAASTLSRIHSDAALSVPALAASLKDADPKVRIRCLFALAEFKGEARQASEAIVELCNDPDIAVRSAATNALREISQPEAGAKKQH